MAEERRTVRLGSWATEAARWTPAMRRTMAGAVPGSGATVPLNVWPLATVSRLPSRPTMSSRSRVSCAVGFQVSYLVHPHRLPVVRHDSHGAPLTGEVGICASRSGVV